MKINPSQIAKAMEIYKTQKPKAPSFEKTSGQERDELVLSDKARVFQLALKAVQENDGLDLSKVEALKKQMQDGTYKISPKDIAQKMVDDLSRKNRI